MIFPRLNPVSFLNFFLKTEANQFFTSIAIRYFAIGMITIFEPIYIYLNFQKLINNTLDSQVYPLVLTLLFFAVIYGLYGILAPFGGQAMMKIGLKKSIMFSHPFFFLFYICLLFIENSIWLIPLAIIAKVGGMILFWPAFHTTFARVSEKTKQGKEVGKLNFVCIFPGITAPFLGGMIIGYFGYPTLFVTILCILFTSAIPLFLSKEVYQIYTDSYLKIFKKILHKKSQYLNLALVSNSIESGINYLLWPLFLATLSISFKVIGGLSSVALGVGALFTLYMGRITDKAKPKKLLAIGSILTSGAWLGKFFVFEPISAFLAQSFYKLSRTAAGIPFQSLFYKKAKAKGPEIDEFIILKEVLVNISRFAMFLIFAAIFLIVPKINIAFIFAAAFSLIFIFLAKTK